MTTEPKYALVEIMGHRMHWGEVREVGVFGTLMLEVDDARTGERHQYSAHAIFGLTFVSKDRLDGEVLRYQEARRRSAERLALLPAQRCEFWNGTNVTAVFVDTADADLADDVAGQDGAPATLASNAEHQDAAEPAPLASHLLDVDRY